MPRFSAPAKKISLQQEPRIIFLKYVPCENSVFRHHDAPYHWSQRDPVMPLLISKFCEQARIITF